MQSALCICRFLILGFNTWQTEISSLSWFNPRMQNPELRRANYVFIEKTSAYQWILHFKPILFNCQLHNSYIHIFKDWKVLEKNAIMMNNNDFLWWLKLHFFSLYYILYFQKTFAISIIGKINTPRNESAPFKRGIKDTPFFIHISLYFLKIADP